MEDQINQFVMEQREITAVEPRIRERSRDRDRDRRRDRRRRSDRDRSDRNYDRDRSRDDPDRDRSRDDPDRDRSRDDPDHDSGDNRSFYGNNDRYNVRDENNGRCSGSTQQNDDDRCVTALGHRGGERWMTDMPTATILLKGLPQHIVTKDILAELQLSSAPIKEVRLMKRNDTGISRGFAFVEFQTIQEAQQWMEQKQGYLLLLNQYPVNMFYSRQRFNMETPDSPWNRSDWICSKCRVHNFKRRDHCFRCSVSREESDKYKDTSGSDQVGTNPCNTLILQGLDALTVEESIIGALSKITALGIKNMKVIRDAATGASLTYAFVEMNSVQDSINLLSTMKRLTAFEVDGKAVIVSFAKNTFSTVIATMHLWSQHAQYPAEQSGYYDMAALHATDAYGQANTTNAAAAVAQQAIEQAQAAKNYERNRQNMQKKMLSDLQQQNMSAELSTHERLRLLTDGTTKHPVPDVSTYQYDETSGYYYDPQTQLYYDANSQYYYNSETGKFLYWDGEKQAYLPAPESTDTQQQPQQQQGSVAALQGAEMPVDTAAGGVERRTEEVEVKDKEKKKEKVKVAKKIAKDMEKWAKSMNAQKDALKDNFKKPAPPTPVPAAPAATVTSGQFDSATADLGYAMMEMKAANTRNMVDHNKCDNKLMPPPSRSETEVIDESGLVASYGGDSGDDEPDLADDTLSEEERFTDLIKMACLLCKRQFSSKEAIGRHQQLSDLHKKNLEEWRKANVGKKSLDDALAYRDRAKERRLKYGTTAPPPPASKKKRPQPVENESIPYEQPTKDGIGSSNIGNQLMQKMGWSQGQGLGKAGQGIVDPVKATHRQAQAGLGARGSAYNVEPGVTYKDCVKKMMFARYHDTY